MSTLQMLQWTFQYHGLLLGFRRDSQLRMKPGPLVSNIHLFHVKLVVTVKDVI